MKRPPPERTRVAVGQWVRRHRLLQQLTQRDFGSAVGLEQPEVSKLEKGKRGIPYEMLASICALFGLTLDVANSEIEALAAEDPTLSRAAVGRWLKQHRLLKNLTQQGLASELGLGKFAVVRLEQGRRAIHEETFVAACRAFDVTLGTAKIQIAALAAEDSKE